MGLLALIVSTVLAAPVGIDLIDDPHFQRGFRVYDPQPGAQVVRRVFQWREGTGDPAWGLAQWSSRYTLAGATLERLPSGAVRLVDEAKQVTAGPGGKNKPDLTLAVDGRREWGGSARRKGAPWPHLLVSQGLPDNTPMLDELAGLDFTVTARLTRADRVEPKGYDPHIHAAQFLLFFTVQNRNRASAGHGDFLWLGVPVYDDRDRPGLSIIGGDQGLGKLIYTPARSDYTEGDITSGEWVTYAADLLPLAKRALREAWRRGFLKDSRNVGDYRLGGMNMGWEVTGNNHVEMQIRGLGLRARRKTD